MVCIKRVPGLAAACEVTTVTFDQEREGIIQLCMMPVIHEGSVYGTTMVSFLY